MQFCAIGNKLSRKKKIEKSCNCKKCRIEAVIDELQHIEIFASLDCKNESFWRIATREIGQCIVLSQGLLRRLWFSPCRQMRKHNISLQSVTTTILHAMERSNFLLSSASRLQRYKVICVSQFFFLTHIIKGDYMSTTIFHNLKILI